MRKPIRIVIQIVLVLVLLAAGAAGLAALTMSRKPLAQKEAPQVHPFVEVVPARTGPVQVSVLGEGTVAPLHESTMAAEVKGTVVEVSPALLSGSDFQKGQTLVKVDPVDYELAVTLSEAEVRTAETRLKQTQEEAAASLEEWRMAYSGQKGAAPEAPPLVAKKPQLAEAKAALAAAQAKLAQARLQLKRTDIQAPFDGRVAQKFADVGQYLVAGAKVAQVFGTQAAEITVHLDQDQLAWIKVPGFTPGADQGSPALVKARLAGRETTWPGRVVRAEGLLDERTRLVPVVIRVERPYESRPPLALGLFVEVEISGRTLEDASRLPRTALRQGGVMWVVDDQGMLRFRKVEVARTQGDEVVVSAGIQTGDQVVVSPLKAVSDGMKVRLIPEAEGSRS